MRKKNLMDKTIEQLRKECWYWLSLYSKLYWANDKGYVKCITTGKKRYYYNDGLHSGHFIPKQSGGITAFMFENIFPQIAESNMKVSGDQYIMGKAINKLRKKRKTKYSAEALINLSKRRFRITKKYLTEKIEEYRSEVYKIAAEKRLHEWKKSIPTRYRYK